MIVHILIIFLGKYKKIIYCEILVYSLEYFWLHNPVMKSDLSMIKHKYFNIFCFLRDVIGEIVLNHSWS